jgi:diadenosine tetraphosphate (Ap4A) HIT family hydrolase
LDDSAEVAQFTESCEFCSELSTTPETRMVPIGADYCALPTRGPLSRGHTLLIPRSHVYALVDSDTPQIVSRIVSNLRSLVENQYGPTVLFEHGSWSPSSLGGCGVRHAHMHFVPTLGRDVSALPVGFDWRGMRADNWAQELVSHDRTTDYLLYWPPELQPVAAFDNRVESQTLRKHVASLLGTGSWDWRTAPVDDFTSVVRELTEAVA